MSGGKTLESVLSATPRRIFISHAFADRGGLAQRLASDLTQRGYQVSWFQSPDDLTPGVDWEELIEQSLDHVAGGAESGCLVLLMTPKSVGRSSGYCLNELAAAQIRRLGVIPVMAVWCDPPLSICRIQWLDMRNCVPVTENEVHYAKGLDQLLRAVELGNIDVTEEFAALETRLEPLDFSADIAHYARGFIGREWLLSDLQQWVDEPADHRIFWLVGDAGMGKTSFTAYVCHTVEGVGAFHLCRHGHEDKADPRRCILSIAYQLSSQLPEYRRYLLRLNLTEEVKKSAETIFDTLIVQPLANIARPERPLLIVIDALDEASSSKGYNELAKFLSKQFPLTPSWVRLLVTSRRNVAELNRLFQHVEPRTMEPEDAGNLRDLRTYLETGIREIEGRPADSAALEKVLEKSEGLFLYAEWVLKELRGGRLSLERVDEFPQGLGRVYFDFFQRQFPDAAEYAERYRSLFELIAVSPGPLPLLLAKRVLGWGSYELQIAPGGGVTGVIIDAVASLFPCQDAAIRPFHQSLLEWLTEPGDSGEYYINQEDGLSRLADACWDEFRRDPAGMSRYAESHLPTFLLEAERWDDLLFLVMSPKPGLLQKWTLGVETEAGVVCLRRLIHRLDDDRARRVIVAGLATQLARIYSRRGEYQQAEHWFSEALSRTSFWRGRRVRAVALHELASLALYRNDRSEATRGYRRAYALCVFGLPVHHDEASANLSGLATVQYSGSLYAKCLRTARRGMHEARLAGDARHRVALARITGAALRAIGRLDKAEEQLKEALVMAERYAEPVEASRLLLQLGFLWNDRSVISGAPPAIAEDYLRQAVTKANETYDFYCSFEAEMGLAVCEVTRGELAQAESRLKRLEALIPEKTHPEIAAGVELGFARLLHTRGRFEAAKERYQAVIKHCRRHDLKYGLRTALVGLGAIYWHAASSEPAEAAWADAMTVASGDSHFKRKLTEAGIRACRADSAAVP